MKKVTELTGLDPVFVKHSGGRIEIGAYLREVHREKQEIGSVYDSERHGARSVLLFRRTNFRVTQTLKLRLRLPTTAIWWIG